jgi:hypothetical protein
LYFNNRNINEIGLSLTFENQHNRRRATFRVDWEGIYNEYTEEYYTDSNEFFDLAREVARWVDDTYWDWVEEIDGWQRNNCD